jgi:hypothetical protein
MSKNAKRIKNKILKDIKVKAEIVFLVSVFLADSPSWLPVITAYISAAIFGLISFGTFLLREERIEKAVEDYVQNRQSCC